MRHTTWALSVIYDFWRNVPIFRPIGNDKDPAGRWSGDQNCGAIEMGSGGWSCATVLLFGVHLGLYF